MAGPLDGLARMQPGRWDHFLYQPDNLEGIYANLDAALSYLRAVQRDKERYVQMNRQKDTTQTYQLWTKNVSSVAAEADALMQQYRTKHSGRYPYLSKKMAENLRKIQELRGSVPEDVLVEKPPEAVSEIDVPKIAGYPTLDDNCLQTVKRRLQNSKVRVIEVCGRKGVGKTTIMKNLYNDEEVTKLFEAVVFVNVGTAETYHKPHQAITQTLMVDREARTDPAEVAERIRAQLTDKKYLLIWDDIDNLVILDKVGILNNDKESKVVITTQSQSSRACIREKMRGKMGLPVNVEQLSSDEAWKMFQEIAEPQRVPGVGPTAQNICNKCSGLPLLINAIARSLREKKLAGSWRAADESLNLWWDPRYQGVKELYSFLMSCYEELRDEKKKNCFLYTSMYPAESKIYIHYLVECWAALRFLGEVNENRRYQNARDCGIDILEQLVRVSLLEFGTGMSYVRMAYSIRELALHILSRLETWQSPWISKISQLNRSNLDRNLSEGRNRFLALLLQKNQTLVRIPPDFFNNMSNLVLLDLFDTGIEQLPPSVSALTSLKGLYLNGCKLLMMLPSEIRSLKDLEVLDIRGTRVPFMPTHLQALTNLRCLRISYDTEANQNRAENVDVDLNVISRLLNLEELVIEVNSYKEWCDDAKYIIKQVASLTNLSILMCSFPSTRILQEFLRRFWENGMQFCSFQFFVACENSKCHQILESFQHKINNYLKYCNGEGSEDLAIAEILPRTDALELVNHKDIVSLSSWVEGSTLAEIRGIVIERCNKMSTMIDNVVDGILPRLEHLYLDNLPNLKWVFRGHFHPGNLSNLQTLTIRNCPELKGIFVGIAVGSFSQLQMLTVKDCPKIEELISVTEQHRNVLQNLKVLVLTNLQNLTSICRYELLAWGSVSLEIRGCDQLNTTFWQR